MTNKSAAGATAPELTRCRRVGVTQLCCSLRCSVRVMTVMLNERAYQHDPQLAAAAHLHGSLDAFRSPTHF